jgi:hypothetical protein
VILRELSCFLIFAPLIRILCRGAIGKWRRALVDEERGVRWSEMLGAPGVVPVTVS